MMLFEAGGRMTSDYLAKIDEVYDRLTIGRTDGALVRLVTAIAEGEDIALADARLQDFMGHLLPHLPRYIPQ
jgi:EpsI family protein